MIHFQPFACPDGVHAAGRGAANIDSPEKTTVGVISLGCAKNLVDTERMLGLLVASGFSIVNAPKDADVLIVNTCGFIEPAKQESINTILELARYKRGRCKTLVVTGCLSERYRDELRSAMPEIDILLGVREYEKLPGLLGATSLCPSAPRILATPPYSAYLRIGDGCNNRCAYCAIPLIRGPLTSVPLESLLDEANRLADDGVTELTLIAQDTSGYGVDCCKSPQLIRLLTRLSDIAALHWIRVLYTYPDTVNRELIDCIRSSGKVVRYLDMPLQHINDPVLRRMNRRGTGDEIRALLDYMKSAAPDFILRTTMMVGFPGETDADFELLLQFLHEYPFDRLGAFAFSPEEGTKAADMPDQIPEAVKQERLDRLMTQQQALSEARAARRVGSVTEMLVTGRDETHTYGRTFAEAPDVDGHVLLPANDALLPGQYRSIRLTKALKYDMMGELL